MGDHAALDAAIRLHEAGSLDLAAAAYRRLLSIQSDHDESLHLLGLIAHQRGDFPTAIDMIGRAARLRPDAAHYRSNLGNALRAAGRLDEAAEALTMARALRPGSAQIASNMGSILVELGRVTQAVCILREAVALDPHLADAHYNLANALCQAGATSEAIEVYGDCLRLRPDFANAQFNLACTLAGMGRATEAVACYRETLRIDPTHAEAHVNLGGQLQEADRIGEAEACFAEAARLRPADHAIQCNLGATLLAQGRGREAAQCFGAVLDVDPDHGRARLGRLVAHLPMVARDEAELTAARVAYAGDLARLGREIDEVPALRHSLASAAGDFRPYLLAYQGEDDRALQQAYGSLMQPRPAPSFALAAAPIQSERLRVGIVSGFFREHTIWTLFLRGWLEQLDPGRFRLFGYHTGARRDACTQFAARTCERFSAGRQTVEAWRGAILADAPHIILYPEIGLDTVSAKLAAHRLARVQCVAWGHPVTTGFSSIDHFLSGALMEPDEADAHYSERLVRLPNLGIYAEPAETPPIRADRAAFGLRPDAVVYWSGQNLPKYRPRYDEVFPRIALAVPQAQFVFIAFGHGAAMTDVFVGRLRDAFARHGLDADAHCVILPQLSQARFLAAASLCDVVLDTLDWSGGKSTLDLLATNPAIVTMRGRFMRGRHSAAILDVMGLPRTIAGTLDEYVALAIRLGRDMAWRGRLRDDVAQRKHLVFRDRAAMEALSAFLERAVRGVTPRVLPAPV